MSNPRKYIGKLILAGCSRKCNLNPGNVGENVSLLVQKWFEDGEPIQTVRNNLIEMGHTFSASSIGQHRKNHLHIADGVVKKPGTEEKPLGELEILDSMIQSGGRQMRLDSARISAEQLLRAIELKQKLTEGSVFDAMYEAMKGVGQVDLDSPKSPADDPAAVAETDPDSSDAP